MKKVKMQLFGSFYLANDEKVLGEEKIHSNKLTSLLAYLLVNRDYMLTHRQLIDIFWEDKSKNPEGALKNLMYRIRNELKALGDEKFICTLPGAYRWNPEIEVETDYEQFEWMVRDLHLAKQEEEKEHLCRKILLCYRGNVSAKIADETWLLPKVTWYRSMYMETVKTLCEILEHKGQWSEIEMLCNQALHVDSLDEDVQCTLIRSLHEQKKYDLAIFQYEKATKMFYENMGIRCPEKLRGTFRWMMSEKGQPLTDIESLLEEAREQDTPQGAFFCDYQIFRQIYQIEARRIDRLGVAEYILLLTLRRNSKLWQGSVVDHGLSEGMNLLEQAVRSSLRVGDVVSRYSPTQLIILLPTCTYEAGAKVADRIKRCFYDNIGKRKLELLYELAELSTMG